MKPGERLFNRNFTLIFWAQNISRLGSTAFSIAMLFWVKHETGSATLIGILMMVSSLPAILAGPFGGTAADRYSRRWIIVLSDTVRGIAVVALALLFFFRPAQINTVVIGLFIVSTVINVITVFFNPAISAAIPDIVPFEKLNAANSLGQISYQLAMLIGNGVGGTLFRILGAPLLFLINGMGYLAAAFCELFLRLPSVSATAAQDEKITVRSYLRDTREGLGYLWKHTGLRDLVLISSFLNFFTVPVILLLAFYVEDTLHASVDWYGFLVAAYGVGALLGYALAGVGRFSSGAVGTLMVAFMVLESFGHGLLGVVGNVWMALGLAVLGGGFGGFVSVMLTTLLQKRTPKEIRGRIFGLLGAIAGAITPVAMGLSGVVADLTGQNIRLIYVVCGLAMTALSISIVFNRPLRRFLNSTDDELEPRDTPLRVIAEEGEH
ncbi:MAG TPA: MFS transporter [Anaerolineaceae bacterium]|nr:MFS transporter [Anaerolineaceae bacterium]